MSPLTFPSNSRPETTVQRRILWIDGGGSYLVYWPVKVITLGSPDSSPGENRLELMAPISRQQCELSYAQGSYRIRPLKSTGLNQSLITQETALTSGDRISMTPGVELMFRIPSPLSLTAVLSVTSSHRWTSATDDVVLLDRLCLLGPDQDCPIRVRNYDQRLVLIARNGELSIKSISAPLNLAQTLVLDQAVEIHGLRLRMTSMNPIDLKGAKAR